jgi:hypothetical protein
LVHESKSPLARHHALGSLEGLGALTEDVVVVEALVVHHHVESGMRGDKSVETHPWEFAKS